MTATTTNATATIPPQFQGHVETQELQRSYGPITGKVAEQVLKDYREVVRKIFRQPKHLEGILYIEGDQLLASHWDPLIILNDQVDTRKYGFSLITPQQFAREMFNSNDESPSHSSTTEFQLIRNPYQKTVVAWERDLDDELRTLTGNNEVLAIPYTTIRLFQSNNGHWGTSTRYELRENALGLIKVIPWKHEELRNGFNYTRFDEDTGVPVRQDTGERKFIGSDSSAKFFRMNSKGLIAISSKESDRHSSRLFGYSSGTSA